VSLTNQDLPKKNTFQKSGYDYEKPIKQKKMKKKLPSLSDQELNKTDDEEKKVKDKDLKQRIDSSRAASQGLYLTLDLKIFIRTIKILFKARQIKSGTW